MVHMYINQMGILLISQMPFKKYYKIFKSNFYILYKMNIQEKNYKTSEVQQMLLKDTVIKTKIN